LSFAIKGTLDKPEISLTKAEFHDLELQFSKDTWLKSPVRIPRLDLVMDKNEIEIKRLIALWQGPETGDQINRFYLGGRSSLQLPSLIKPDALTINLDLKMLDATWNMELPAYFSGKATLRDFKISHAAVIPISPQRRSEWQRLRAQAQEAAPLLTGAVDMLGGTWTLPPLGDRKKRRMAMHLDLAIHMKSDLRVMGQLVGGTNALTTLLSDIDLEVEPGNEAFYLKGTLYHPRPAGTLKVRQGALSMLNHKFDIVNPSDQKYFFSSDISRILDNSIAFDTGKLNVQSSDELQRQWIVPYFRLIAKTQIDAETVSQNLGESSLYDRIVLVRLEGSPFDDAGVVFEQYQLVNQKPEPLGESVVMQAKEDQKKLTQLLTLLNPGTYYAELLTEFQKEGVNSQRTRSLLANMTETQVNRVFRSMLRPVERDLARTMGLYDITLDYNLGSGVNEALGLSKTNEGDDENESGDTETVLGIKLVENLLSDRLFVTLKTEIQRQQESDVTSLQLSKYLITYYLTSWLTFNYSNKQNDSQEPLKGALSLEASLAF
jgi:hypothetical protein